MPPTSLILPEHHHIVLPPSLHNRVSITATGLTRASLLVLAAAYQPQHLRKWVRGLPRALLEPVARKLRQQPTVCQPATSAAPLPDHSQPRPDIVTLNVQMSLRPKLRALLSWDDHPAAIGLRLSLFPTPGTRLAPSISSPLLVTMSCPTRLNLSSVPTTITAQLSQRCHAWHHCASTAWGVLILWGNEPFLLAVDDFPAHGSLPTYTVGRLGAISSPHRYALQRRGLRPANLCRLLCDVVLTTILLHKRHAVLLLPLAGNYSPQEGGPCGKDPR